MKAGETIRADCPECGAEFEVTYEPKAKGNPYEAKGIKPMELTVCPFCEADLDGEDDSDTDDDE